MLRRTLMSAIANYDFGDANYGYCPTEPDRYDLEEMEFNEMILYAVADAYWTMLDEPVSLAKATAFKDLFDYAEMRLSLPEGGR